MTEETEKSTPIPESPYSRTPWRTRIFFAVLMGLFIFTAISFQRGRSYEIEVNPLYIDDMFMPQAKYAKVMAFGYDHLMADFLYLRAIQAFGARFKLASENYASTYQFFDTITDLDPKFTEAYEFGSLVMNESKNYESGIRLNAKGFYKQRYKYRLAYLNTYTANWQLKSPGFAKVWLQKSLSAADSPDWLERWGPWLDTKMGRYDIGLEGRIRNYLDTYTDSHRAIETRISLDNMARTVNEWNLEILKQELGRYLEEHDDLPESLAALAGTEGYLKNYRAAHYPRLMHALASLSEYGVNKEEKALEIFDRVVFEMSGVPISPFDDPTTPEVEDYYVMRRDLTPEYYKPALENDALVVTMKDMRETIEQQTYQLQVFGLREFFNENERYPANLEELFKFMGDPEVGATIKGDALGNPWLYDPEEGTIRSSSFPNG